ncbi:MAG TPA: hypothetical protein VD908_08900 [Cytophagales bacterium]|nr:hypothetical protein [Cytophagales bacterium]
MNDIDKIFHNKLKEFEKTPHPRVWEKLNAGLKTENNKRKGIFWYSIAAGIILMIFASLLILRYNQEEKIMAQKTLPIEKIEGKPLLTDNTNYNPINKTKILPVKKEYSKIRISTVSKAKNTISPKKKENVEIEEDFIFMEGSSLPVLEEEIIEEKVEDELAFVEQQGFDNSLPLNTISVVIKRGMSSSIAQSMEENDKNSLQKSKLGRMYAEVLNLKNGEKVNLNEFSNLLAFDRKEKQTQNK